jgi:hypothetical protein
MVSELSDCCQQSDSLTLPLPIGTVQLFDYIFLMNMLFVRTADSCRSVLSERILLRNRKLEILHSPVLLRGVLWTARGKEIYQKYFGF